MRSGHARRARTPSARNASRLQRVLVAATMVLPVLAALPAGAWILFKPAAGEVKGGDAIRAVIRDAGFDPVIPPSLLRGPGALYTIDGSSYTKVCDVDQARVAPALQRSATLELSDNRLENVEVAASASLVGRLKAALGADRVAAVHYRLSDVAVSEIPMDVLRNIRNQLLERADCQAVVDELLGQNKKVCQGYAVLSGTTQYRLQIDARLELGAETSVPVTKLVQEAIAAEAHGNIKVHSTTEYSGANLYLGIKLSPLCITPITATEPSVAAEPGAFRGWVAALWSTLS